MCPNCISGGIGAVAGGLWGLATSFATEAYNGFPEGSAGRIAKATGKGIVVGGVIGATGNIPLGAATAATLGAVVTINAKMYATSPQLLSYENEPMEILTDKDQW